MKKNKFKKVAQDVILTEIKSLKKLKTSEVELIPTRNPTHKFPHENHYL